MAVLEPHEYDISYFFGRDATYQHNAGYSKYKRWYRISDDFVPASESTGEYFKDIAKKYFNEHNLQAKKFLDVGCAAGFIVEDLREMGVNAYGLDVSSYIYTAVEPSVKPYITIADARTHLKTYSPKEWDVLFSRWFLGCIDDVDLPSLITDMNKCSKQQVHIINTTLLPQFYNRKSIQDWLNMGFSKGTILVDSDDIKTIHRK